MSLEIYPRSRTPFRLEERRITVSAGVLAWRRQLGLSTKDAAFCLGRSYRTVLGWEWQDRKPSVVILQRMQRLLLRHTLGLSLSVTEIKSHE